MRGSFPSSLLSQYMHAHCPLPSLLRGCLLGWLGVGRGVALSCKLSFSLCEQVGNLSGLWAPRCQPPTACSQRPHHWLSGLRPSHFPCPLFPNPGLSGPLLGQSVLPSHCQAGACGHLSVSVLCPTPPPLPSATCGTNQLPSAPLQPAHTCGLAGLLLPGLSPTVPPKD